MTKFLNVDLEIRGTLGGLAEELAKKKLVVLYQEPRFAVYETYRQTKTADATIRELVRVLGTMSPRARRMWRKLRARDFDIGIECEQEPWQFKLALEPATVAAVAKLGGRIVVTVYAPERPKRRAKKQLK